MRTFFVIYTDDDGDNHDWFIRAPDVETVFEQWVETTGVDWVEMKPAEPGATVSRQAPWPPHFNHRIVEITDFNTLPAGPVAWEHMPVVAWLTD